MAFMLHFARFTWPEAKVSKGNFVHFIFPFTICDLFDIFVDSLDFCWCSIGYSFFIMFLVVFLFSLFTVGFSGNNRFFSFGE